MRARIEKYIYIRTADVYIHNFECTYENVGVIFDIFAINQAIMLIGVRGNESSFFDKIEKLKLKYKLNCEKISSDVMAITIHSNLKSGNFFRDILEYGIEGVMIYFISNDKVHENFLGYSRYKERKLIKEGLADACVGIAFDEEIVSVFFRKEIYNVKQIVSKIKEIF